MRSEPYATEDEIKMKERQAQRERQQQADLVAREERQSIEESERNPYR